MLQGRGRISYPLFSWGPKSAIQHCLVCYAASCGLSSLAWALMYDFAVTLKYAVLLRLLQQTTTKIAIVHADSGTQGIKDKEQNKQSLNQDVRYMSLHVTSWGVSASTDCRHTVTLDQWWVCSLRAHLHKYSHTKYVWNLPDTVHLLNDFSISALKARATTDELNCLLMKHNGVNRIVQPVFLKRNS